LIFYFLCNINKMLLQDWKQENPGPYTELHLNFTQHKTKKLLSEYQFLYITSIKESYPAQLTGIYPTNKIQDLQNYINLNEIEEDFFTCDDFPNGKTIHKTRKILLANS